MRWRSQEAFVADAVRGIAAQWREFAATDIGGARDAHAYGIMCGADADGFEYMCGVEVADFADAPAHAGRIRIPAQRYAVFLHEGDASHLHETWRAIWDEWLPASGFSMAHTPEFERYPERTGPHGAEPIEIWASIRGA